MQTVSRLIDQFVPEHYQLTLSLDRMNRTFAGTVVLNGTSPLSAGQIIVHAKELRIGSATVDGKEADFSLGQNDELIIVHPDIHTGRHIIVIAFHGTITDGMHGLYPCYFEHNGIKKELLATQFESHHAREVFPCIDEPEAKATFDVILATEPDIVVLGNMPIRQQRTEKGQLVTYFATTPRMSTYLLAWVAGELHRKTAITESGVEVNVWATPAQPPDSLDFALDIATRTIDFFNGYFGTAYPLPKSDHVALPDFSAGAMENWGLITYREVVLLADPNTTSVSSKHYIAAVIAHELSHQWFGNLVTMKWWNDLWLNESFANFMQYFSMDALYPKWNMWLDFTTGDSSRALRRDSLEGVQPVQVEVRHPDEINALFDSAIVYAKGSRLLRMLHGYIGGKAFQAGLQAYFETFKYGNTESEDLWKAFQKASSKDIAGFMNVWITQSGYPVVHANQNGDQLTLSQEQFFVGAHASSKQLWPIPLSALDPSIPNLFDTHEITIARSPDTILHLNSGDTAHFITHYDDGLLAHLVSGVRSGELAQLDRLQLLHEQTLLARGGVISTATLIPLLDAYRYETTEAVWDIIVLAVGELKKFVETNTVAEKKLRLLAGSLARKQYERLGWTAKNNEPETDAKLRAIIVGLMLYSENDEVINTAIELYRTSTLEQLDPELRGLIIGTSVRYGSDNTITDTLLRAYKANSSAELQEDIASGLTSTRDKQTITKLLGLITDGTIIRPQDVRRWFVWLIRNRDGRDLTWQWLRDNWAWIEQTFGSGMSYDDFPRYTASSLVTRQQLDEYRAFFTPMLASPSLTRVITIGIGEIEGCVALIERDGTAVQDALLKL